MYAFDGKPPGAQTKPEGPYFFNTAIGHLGILAQNSSNAELQSAVMYHTHYCAHGAPGPS